MQAQLWQKRLVSIAKARVKKETATAVSRLRALIAQPQTSALIAQQPAPNALARLTTRVDVKAQMLVEPDARDEKCRAWMEHRTRGVGLAKTEYRTISTPYTLICALRYHGEKVNLGDRHFFSFEPQLE